MNSYFYTYIITNLVNGKLYVGKTNNPEKRWTLHKNYAKNTSLDPKFNYPIYKGIRKYGIINFTFEVIECFGTESEALESEKGWIMYLRSFGIALYNITDGGEGTSGHIHSTETKEKISKSNKGKKNRLGLINSTEHNAKSLTSKLRSFLMSQQESEILSTCQVCFMVFLWFRFNLFDWILP